MNTSIIVSTLIIGIIGACLHFTYEWSNHNKYVAIFSAVNESVWEHIKIALTPTLLWTLVEYPKYYASQNFLSGKAFSMLVIIILIPVLFYSYKTFTKKSILPVDIVCFFVTVLVSRITFNNIITAADLPFAIKYMSLLLLFFEILAYSFLTFNPEKNFLFKDPITNKFGLEGHSHEHNHNHEHEEKEQ